MKIIFQQNNTIYTCLPLTCMKCIQCKQPNGRNTRAYRWNNWKTYIYIFSEIKCNWELWIGVTRARLSWCLFHFHLAAMPVLLSFSHVDSLNETNIPLDMENGWINFFYFFFCLSLFWCQTKAGVNMTIIILTPFKDIFMLYSSNVMNLKDFWCLYISFSLKSMHSVLCLLVCTFNFKIMKMRLKFWKNIDFNRLSMFHSNQNHLK